LYRHGIFKQEYLNKERTKCTGQWTAGNGKQTAWPGQSLRPEVRAWRESCAHCVQPLFVVRLEILFNPRR